LVFIYFLAKTIYMGFLDHILEVNMLGKKPILLTIIDGKKRINVKDRLLAEKIINAYIERKDVKIEVKK